MKKAEFIKMLRQDNETEKEPRKTLYAQVIDCTIIALIDEDKDFEVDSSITVKDLYKLIGDKGKKSPEHCVGPFEAARLIAEKLKTQHDGVARLENTAMDMFEGNAHVPRRRINLDDL